MGTEQTQAAGAVKVRALQLTLLIEGAVALLLGALGVWFIISADQPASWTGFGLIGLGLLLYMLRGQVIIKLSVGKDGIAWEMAEAAKRIAEDARHQATIAKGVASQYAPPPTVRPGKQKGLRATVAAKKEGWEHPGLEPGEKVANDPQKNQWGGQAQRNDRRLDAKVTQADKDWYDILMTVSSTDPSKPIAGRVRFHLHDSFSRDVVTVEPKDGVARLDRYAYGAFTIGAEVEGEPETYLELDMAARNFDAPERFKAL